MTAADQRETRIEEGASSGAQSNEIGDELRRYSLNPLRGRGHGKVWAEDAKANIWFLRGKLEIIRARERMRQFEPSRKPHTVDLRTSTPTGVSTVNELTRQVPESVGFVEHRLLHNSSPSPSSSADRNEEVAATCRAVETLLDKAEDAALGNCPRFSWFISWWSGTGVEATYRNLHYAEALIARLYTVEEVRCAVPDALRRVITALDYNHPTRTMAIKMLHSTENSHCTCSAHELSEIITVGHETADRSRVRLHSFRNILLIGTVLNILLVAAFIILVAKNPTLVPLCFTPHEALTNGPGICPTRRGLPSGGDLFIVAVLGLLGGSLSAAVFVRGLYTNSTPYNVAIPLALLKLPAGATVAVLGMILLAGDFVPGFSAVNTPVQILAYAILLGFSQQIFTQMIDHRAERLIANVPTKVRQEDGPHTKGRRESSY